MIIIFLPCKDESEANQIGQALLRNKLAACTKTFPASSRFLWQGFIETAQETVLMIESTLAKFEEIESTVTELHSYETPVLAAIEVAKMSKATNQWLEQELT